jgi:hypothetical protein
MCTRLVVRSADSFLGGCCAVPWPVQHAAAVRLAAAAAQDETAGTAPTQGFTS